MEEKKKSKKGLIITIIVLIVLLLGLGAYIVYDKFYTKEETPKEITYKQLTEEEVEALNDSLIVRTKSDYDNTLKGEDLFLDGVNIYTITSDQIMQYMLIKYCIEEGIEMDPLKMEYSYHVDYDNLGDNESEATAQKYYWKDETKVTNKDVPSVSKDVIDNMIKETFNTNKVFDITKDTEYYNSDKTFGVFTYNKDENKFFIASLTATPTEATFYEKAQMIDYEQDKDMVYVYSKLYNCVNVGTACCYKEKAWKKGKEVVCNKSTTASSSKIDSKIVKQTYEIDFDYLNQTYSDEFDTYKVTFKSDTNGNYHWVSSEISTDK